MAARWNYDEIEKMKADGMKWTEIADAVGSDDPTKLMQNYHSFKQRQNKKQSKLAEASSSTDLETTIADLKQKIASLEQMKQNLRVVSELQQQVLTLEAEIADLQSSTNVVGDENLDKTNEISASNESDGVTPQGKSSEASQSDLEANAKDFVEHFDRDAVDTPASASARHARMEKKLAEYADDPQKNSSEYFEMVRDHEAKDNEENFLDGDALITQDKYQKIKEMLDEDLFDENEIAEILKVPQDVVYDVMEGIVPEGLDMGHDFHGDDI